MAKVLTPTDEIAKRFSEFYATDRFFHKLERYYEGTVSYNGNDVSFNDKEKEIFKTNFELLKKGNPFPFFKNLSTKVEKYSHESEIKIANSQNQEEVREFDINNDDAFEVMYAKITGENIPIKNIKDFHDILGSKSLEKAMKSKDVSSEDKLRLLSAASHFEGKIQQTQQVRDYLEEVQTNLLFSNKENSNKIELKKEDRETFEHLGGADYVKELEAMLTGTHQDSVVYKQVQEDRTQYEEQLIQAGCKQEDIDKSRAEFEELTKISDAKLLDIVSLNDMLMTDVDTLDGKGKSKFYKNVREELIAKGISKEEVDEINSEDLQRNLFRATLVEKGVEQDVVRTLSLRDFQRVTDVIKTLNNNNVTDPSVLIQSISFAASGDLVSANLQSLNNTINIGSFQSVNNVINGLNAGKVYTEEQVSNFLNITNNFEESTDGLIKINQENLHQSGVVLKDIQAKQFYTQLFSPMIKKSFGIEGGASYDPSMFSPRSNEMLESVFAFGKNGEEQGELTDEYLQILSDISKGEGDYQLKEPLTDDNKKTFVESLVKNGAFGSKNLEEFYYHVAEASHEVLTTEFLDDEEGKPYNYLLTSNNEKIPCLGEIYVDGNIVTYQIEANQLLINGKEAEISSIGITSGEFTGEQFIEALQNGVYADVNLKDVKVEDIKCGTELSFALVDKNGKEYIKNRNPELIEQEEEKKDKIKEDSSKPCLFRDLQLYKSYLADAKQRAKEFFNSPAYSPKQASGPVQSAPKVVPPKDEYTEEDKSNTESALQVIRQARDIVEDALNNARKESEKEDKQDINLVKNMKVCTENCKNQKEYIEAVKLLKEDKSKVIVEALKKESLAKFNGPITSQRELEKNLECYKEISIIQSTIKLNELLKNENPNEEQQASINELKAKICKLGNVQEENKEEFIQREVKGVKEVEILSKIQQEKQSGNQEEVARLEEDYKNILQENGSNNPVDINKDIIERSDEIKLINIANNADQKQVDASISIFQKTMDKLKILDYESNISVVENAPSLVEDIIKNIPNDNTNTEDLGQ